MHTNLIKISILLNTCGLILICMSAYSQTLQTAALPPTSQVAEMPANTSITSPINKLPTVLSINTSEPLAAQPREHSPISSYLPENMLLVVQPLGSLATIPWNDLNVSGFHFIASKLLIFSTDKAFWAQGVTGEENPDLIQNETEIYHLPQEISLADEYFRYSNRDGEIRIYCAACHDTHPTIYQSIIASYSEQSTNPQGYSGQFIDCRTCHLSRPIQATWHLLGGD